MTLVTRCPSCDTTFKVVRDQLRISEGWVRCGRCSHVFDASADLREIDDEPPREAPLPEPPPEPAREPLHDSVVADPPHEVPLGKAASIPAVPLTGIVADGSPPEPDRIDGVSSNFSPDTTARHPSIAEIAPSLAIDAIGPVQSKKALRRARVKSVKAALERRKAAQPESLAAEPTEPAPMIQTASEYEASVANVAGAVPFLRASATPEFWQRPKVRAALGVGIMVVLMLLGLQVLHRERDAIVARQPSLRPVLSRLCVFTDCKLSALRQIADITIDGTGFAREKAGEGYRLSFTLRNAAPVPLAMPAVELSLLDSQEQIVVRRVLMPADFNAPAELPARAERAASLPLALTGAEAAALPPIVGYRVVAFYP